jgi:hypothetical protein
MKAKYLIIVSLILAILAIGAVSASEDISEDIASDASDDVLTEEVVSDELAAGEAEEPVIETAENADVVEVSDDVDTVAASDNDDVLEATDSNDVLGGKYSTRYFNGYEYESWVRTSYYDMNTQDYTYEVGEVYDEFMIDGVVAFYVDGAQVYSRGYSILDNKHYAEIHLNEIVLPGSFTAGMHTVTTTYFKNGAAPVSVSALVKFWPALYYVGYMSVGEVNYLRVYAGPGASGSATLYLKDAFTDQYAPVASGMFSNGLAIFQVGSPYKRTLDYKVGCIINGQMFEDEFSIYVKDNTPGYTASASSTIYAGNAATVTFSGPRANGQVSIYVDGKLSKRTTYFGGRITELIPGLGLGVHQITVQYSMGDDFFSKTFNVNVIKKAKKISLKLKKVKVKKSAKKLVLKATLKINGKKAKGKKVTFKFNGKKFKAKTNKKGVAKVKIKKKYLKKLKVGKKVKYSVKYGSKTVKRSVKVKK